MLPFSAMSLKFTFLLPVSTQTTSSLSFRSGIVEENEQACEREIACRVET